MFRLDLPLSFILIMPVVRQLLRERCNIQLKIRTTTTPRRHRHISPALPSSDDEYAYVPRELKPTRHKRVLTDPTLRPLNRATAGGLLSLYELIPFIFLSFHHGHLLPPSLITDNSATFTHVIKITHATPNFPVGAIDLQLDSKRGLSMLLLAVPAPPVLTEYAALRARISKPADQRNRTVLTDKQLVTARDFLSLALPYYSQAYARTHDIPAPSADRVRVLITAPVGDGAAADIMSVVVCYLTFCSEERAGAVLGYITSEHKVPILWREGMSRNVDFIDWLAITTEL